MTQADSMGPERVLLHETRLQTIAENKKAVDGSKHEI